MAWNEYKFIKGVDSITGELAFTGDSQYRSVENLVFQHDELDTSSLYRWTQDIDFQGKSWRFIVSSRGATRFYLDGKLIVNEWWNPTTNLRPNGTVGLDQPVSGVFVKELVGVHSVVVEHLESPLNTGAFSFAVVESQVGDNPATIPDSDVPAGGAPENLSLIVQVSPEAVDIEYTKGTLTPVAIQKLKARNISTTKTVLLSFPMLTGIVFQPNTFELVPGETREISVSFDSSVLETYAEGRSYMNVPVIITSRTITVVPELPPLTTEPTTTPDDTTSPSTESTLDVSRTLVPPILTQREGAGTNVFRTVLPTIDSV